MEKYETTEMHRNGENDLQYHYNNAKYQLIHTTKNTEISDRQFL